MFDAPKIDLVEGAGNGDKKPVLVKGYGKGFATYQPKPSGEKPDAAGDPFKVTFEKSGSFDEGALKADFAGSVKLVRPGSTMGAAQVAMSFEKSETEALTLKSITSTGDVRFITDDKGTQTTATGQVLVWTRATGEASLTGDSAGAEPAEVVRADTRLRSPVIDFVIKGNSFERMTTRRGGSLIGKSKPMSGDKRDELEPFTITWTRGATYDAEPSRTGRTIARLNGDVRLDSKDVDLNADRAVVTFGAESNKRGLSLVKMTATGNVYGKVFVPDDNDFRRVSGDTVEWNRARGHVVVSSRDGKAMVLTRSQRWIGRRLDVNVKSSGRVTATAKSSRHVTLYDEIRPRTRPADDDEWEPIR